MNAESVTIKGGGAKILALLPLASIILPIWGALSWGVTHNRPDLTLAFAVVAGLMLLTFLFLGITSNGSRVNLSDAQEGNSNLWAGWMRLTIGDDGRFSTSKMMVVLWTLIFSASLTFLSVMVWFGRLTQEQAFGQEWSSYLLLLGGPFAAAVLAKSITSSKSTDGEKTTTSETTLGDVASTDAGTLSLPDTQYSIFTLVAILYFVGAFLLRIRAYALNGAGCLADPTAVACTVALPEIPAALLGLTSLAAATYVGAKAVSNEGPRILSVLPEGVAIAQPLTIRLINAPQDLRQGQVVVKFTPRDGGDVILNPASSPVSREGVITIFTVEAPESAGTYNVVVSLPSGETASHSETVT